jgi:hypothetical protein
MKPFLPLSVTALIFTSCGPMVSYVGQKMPATEDVQVYVDPSAISRSYTIIGKGYLNFPPTNAFTSYERMQRSALAQARKNGANAVLIRDWAVYNQQTRASTTISRDTSGRTTGSETVTGPVIQQQTEILFLRYR